MDETVVECDCLRNLYFLHVQDFLREIQNDQMRILIDLDIFVIDLLGTLAMCSCRV